MKASAWPPTYLVSDWIDRSTPASSGLNSSPALQVASMAVSTPRARQACATARTSCISKVREAGLSIITRRVAGPASASTSSAVARGAK